MIRDAAADGLAVLLVEQQARRVIEVADRLCVLRRGELVLDGPAADVRSR